MVYTEQGRLRGQEDGHLSGTQNASVRSIISNTIKAVGSTMQQFFEDIEDLRSLKDVVSITAKHLPALERILALQILSLKQDSRLSKTVFATIADNHGKKSCTS